MTLFQRIPRRDDPLGLITTRHLETQPASLLKPMLRRAFFLAAAAATSWTLCARDAAPQFVASATPGAPAPPAIPLATELAALPEPIYWKQQLFLIPYKWQSATGPTAARAVLLFVSRDRGASWQKISEAKPEVKAFNYRAEGDGEYWFAVRTADGRGQLWPAGPYRPELRVIVDTTIPRIDELRARPTEAGAIAIQCRATDINLSPASLQVETQLASNGPWQLVAIQVLDDAATGPQLPASFLTLPTPGFPLHAIYQPPAGVRPLAVRATISDRAGNSAVYQTPVVTTPLLTGPLLSQPAMSTAISPPTTTPAAAAAAPSALSSAAAATTDAWASTTGAATHNVAPPVTQPWPAGATARPPLQLWTNNAASADDGITSYGNPHFAGTDLLLKVGSAPVKFGNAAESPVATSTASPLSTATDNDARVSAHFVGAVRTDSVSSKTPPTIGASSSATNTGPQLKPLEPPRQAASASATALSSTPSVLAGPVLAPIGQSRPSEQTASVPITPIGGIAPPTHRPDTPPKLVGSRTFALEYDLDDNSQAGVARVELWGTRDGGQTWNRYSVDDDSRSPLVATVDGEGLYGFKIMVQSATGAAITPPRPGEEPELWVSVDLKRPIIELTSIERGLGNLADHLVLHWRVLDNNLEPRPISLFFSSRPMGPWSVIAANLENTGEYAWRVERYVPRRIYIRAEARDEAGNLAAYQTREPVEFNRAQVSGRLVPTPPSNPAGPTALRAYDAH